jgi:translation initiation factor IF-2
MDALNGKGFSDLNPNTKLTPEMLSVLDKEFGSDKSIKQQADNTKLDKPATEAVEIPQDAIIVTHKPKEEEPDVLIKSTIVTKDEPESIAADKVQLEGTKVIGKVDLEEKPKKGKKKKDEPVVEEPVVEEEVKPVKKKEEEEPTPEARIETKYQKLEGTKTIGTIDLSKLAEKPKKKEETDKKD